MIDVARVYNIVRDLCNKDQKGFVSPEVFNTFASAAQQNVFNEMFTELKMATRLRASNADSGRDKSVYKQVEEDLSYYIVEALLPDTDFVAETTEGAGDAVNPDEAYIARKPLNLARIISMTVANTNTSVELVYDAEQGARILNSNLSAPTEDFPVALIMSNTIQVFPDTLAGDGVNIKYYRSPRSAYPIDIQPRYSTVNLDPASGLVVQNLVDSRNFDLPSHYLTEVVAEICKMIGVRLRDKDLFAFANQETQAN